MEKICSRCKIAKNTSEFYKSRCCKDGFDPRCKECFKIYYKGLYKDIKVDEKERKLCTRCKEVKEIDNFSKHYYSKDKKDSWCKQCNKVYNESFIKFITCECGRTIKYSFDFPKHLLTKFHQKHVN